MDLQLSVPVTTKVVCSNPAHGDVYSIQHYVTKIVSDLRQVGGFLRVLRFPPPMKLTATMLLEVALNSITRTRLHESLFLYLHDVCLAAKNSKL
jgi:hypothetical protein